MRSTKKEIKVGDRVTFDTNDVDLFIADTASEDKAVQDYRRLVLAGINQVGIVKETGFALATVIYPDGWELPVPVKYLVVLSA